MEMDESLRIQKLDEIRSGTPLLNTEVLYKNERKIMPVYEIDLDFLIYNKHNGRISSMAKSYEKQHGELIPENSSDKKIIEKFLYASNPHRNKTTREDLIEKGQLKYGIVTRDGVIIDGNRRAMLLNKIAHEKSESPAYFKAAILDETIAQNPKEIMKLEAIYQMGEDEKLGYNAIEKYLKCDDLLACGFNEDEIGHMMGEERPTIDEWLNIKRLMDDYLSSLEYDGIYTRLDKTEGLFVDLSRYLKRYENGSSLAKWAYQKEDLSDLKAIFFDYIRGRFSEAGKSYRLIGRPSKEDSFFCNEYVWKEFRDRHFESIEPITEAEASIDSLRQDNPDTDLEKLLKIRDEDWEKSTDSHMKANMGKSEQSLRDYNDQSAPIKLLERALSTLLKIDSTQEAFFQDSQVRTLVHEINRLTYEFKKTLG